MGIMTAVALLLCGNNITCMGWTSAKMMLSIPIINDSIIDVAECVKGKIGNYHLVK